VILDRRRRFFFAFRVTNSAVSRPTVHTDAELARVFELLQRFGHNTTSFQVLEPRLRYWFEEGGEACVAYADCGGAWVVAGGPICAQDRHIEVIERFTEHARSRRKRVRFFALEEDISAASEYRCLKIGEQPVWDPSGWEAALKTKRSLREQLRRARAKGVTVRLAATEEVNDPEHPTRRSIDAMMERWLESRAMAPMGFVVHLDPYNLPEERRFFIAEREGQVVGTLIAVPIYARDGWFFEDVLRDPAAPNGTIELLFHHAMLQVAAEGSSHATFGLAPLAGTDHKVMRFIRDHTRWLYDFEGLRRFKAKLLPTSWHPVYLAYPNRERGVRAVIDTLTAFANGSWIGFGVRTLIHRAVVVTLVLALLLIPWTIGLAMVPTRQWFPSHLVQDAWIAYDVVLFVVLVTLAARWRSGLAVLASALAATDFLLGCAQLIRYNGARADGVLSWLLIAAALIAPLFASIFLWLARKRGGMYDFLRQKSA
jgi:hypothetical protein